MPNEEDHANALKDQLKAVNKLKKIGELQEINDYFDFLLDTCSKLMVDAFTTDRIKSWDDFQKLKGQITAYLYPIQEVRGADSMETVLKNQLNQFYGKQS